MLKIGVSSPCHFQVTKHKAELSHELLAGAASFYAARKYEEHVAQNGPPPNHAVAKELLYVSVLQLPTVSYHTELRPLS